MGPIDARRFANVHANQDLICVDTMSGRRLLGRDADARIALFRPNATPEELGRAVLNALSSSRFLTKAEADLFFELEAAKKDVFPA